jgi:predicted amidophosphoribosyltransferase
MHKHKLKKRTYNHAFLLAKQFARRSGMQVDNDILVKHDDTLIKHTLSKQARKENIIGSFKTIKKAPKNIILIDDVVTTCATANECAKVLKNAGAKKVIVLAIARTPL